MPRFSVLSPDAEILGQGLIGYKEAIGAENFRSFFEQHGLGSVVPDQWYPYQSLINVFNEMVEASAGRMFDFVSIGIKMAENGLYPPGVGNLPFAQIVGLLGEASKMNVRGSDLGEITVEPIAEKHVKVTARQPLPDDLGYGLMYGLGRRFLPKGTHVTVIYDETMPRRDHGGPTTTFHIKWD
jgi:hypothetical protein